MKYVNLGRSGLKVSRLCLGCMSYGEPERLPQPWSLDEIDGIIPPLPDTPPSLTPPSAFQNY